MKNKMCFFSFFFHKESPEISMLPSWTFQWQTFECSHDLFKKSVQDGNWGYSHPLNKGEKSSETFRTMIKFCFY